jgi:HEAT repeat protein
MRAAAEFDSCVARFRSSDPALRREAAEALAEFQESAVEPLIEGLRDQNPGVQEASMASLIRISGGRVVALLVPLLRQDAATRNLAAEVLEQTGRSALDLLLPFVSHGDPNLRKFIIDTLGKLVDRRAVPSLLTALEDDDANVRAASAEALGRLRAPEAVLPLLALLNDEEWVVFAAIEALGRIGASKAVDPLMDRLKTGSEPVRYAVIEALGHFPDAAMCVRPMLRWLHNADPDLRNLLIKSMVNLVLANGMDFKALIQHEAVTPAFIDALESQDIEVVRAAMKGLALIEDPKAAQSLLGLIARATTAYSSEADDLCAEAKAALYRCWDETILRAALESTAEPVLCVAVELLGKARSQEAVPALTRLAAHVDRTVRRAAINSLGLIGGARAMEVVLKALEDENGHVRREAASVLGKWANRQGIEPLCGRLAVEPYQDVRLAIVEALCAEPDPIVIERLMRLLQHESAEVRAAAALGLGKLRPPAALRSLMDIVSDPHAAVRAAAIEAIGQYRITSALETVLLALSDDHEKVRLASVLALAGWNDPKAEEALRVEGLHDSDLWVRYRAGEALGAKGSLAAVSALLQVARNDREPSLLRRMAVQSLGRIGDPQAKETIGELMWDRDADVSASAAEALDVFQRGEEGGDPWK